ncbi:MAG: Fe-S-binding domain-containing protein, partial [Anaerolineaceae bacterium]
MEFIANQLLTIILFIPAVAALALLLVPARYNRAFRYTALAASLLSFILSLLVWAGFDPNGGFQFEVDFAWYPALNSSFHLGVDGISLTMMLLTTLLTPLAILASHSIKEKIKAYMILFL